MTPRRFPVLVNGGFLSRTADGVTDPIHARAIVLSDGRMEMAIVVVDSCMMPRLILDKAKELVFIKTGIPPAHILISATHTHTAPSAFGALGTPRDPRYPPFLVGKVVKAVVDAKAGLVPAKAGWNLAAAPEFTALRRWIRRPDRIGKDPFGESTVRATMHAGRNWDDVTGESGPEDPDLTLISIQDLEGRPIAILANFSMHYFAGMKAISSDYFGRFAESLKMQLGAGDDFVGIMSHGCSGDIWRRDYTLRNWAVDPPSREEQPQVDDYADRLARLALVDYEGIHHRTDLDLAMAETRMTLKYRVPDAGRLKWATEIVEEMGDRDPKTQVEVYAMEQLILNERQQTEIVLQGLRIGDMAIATMPNEVYALTGLKLKAMSPLPRTMVIELANGADGYIPPPEQHFLGGYNTWAARSAGLEVQAEPRITEACLKLLEKVSMKTRRVHKPARARAVRDVLALVPSAYWRLDEFGGRLAADQSGRQRDGTYEDGVVFYLEGARSAAFSGTDELNRAAHFCGGRVQARIPVLGSNYSVSIWFWNGMPDGAREIAGWMFSRDGEQTDHGDRLGLDGEGRLVFLHGDGRQATGRKVNQRWTWNHALLVRKGQRVLVYLNGASRPEIETRAPASFPRGFQDVFIGGRFNGVDSWEGRLDEVAVYNRALTVKELRRLSVP